MHAVWSERSSYNTAILYAYVLFRWRGPQLSQESWFLIVECNPTLSFWTDIYLRSQVDLLRMPISAFNFCSFFKSKLSFDLRSQLISKLLLRDSYSTFDCVEKTSDVIVSFWSRSLISHRVLPSAGLQGNPFKFSEEGGRVGSFSHPPPPPLSTQHKEEVL